MNIGFDAKRAFHNRTGLGNYSRSLIRSLARYYPENQYFLFNPRPSALFLPGEECIEEVLPSGLNRYFPSIWRSSRVKKDLLKNRIDLYHGLSHEIPIGIGETGIRSVVTIHDLMPEKFPDHYSFIDRRIYQGKNKYACSHADGIIAISEQTKKDIIYYYSIPEERVSVCYQSCNEIFSEKVSENEKQDIRQQYQLPDHYFLYVGSIIERKNLLNICKAMNLLKKEVPIPLVVIGEGGTYKEQVKDYIREKVLEEQVIFLSERASTISSPSFQNAADFPAIYQSATAMIYPSIYEGFGLPVLESLWSRLPVITSNISCLPEVGGNAAYYVNPESAEEIALAMKEIYYDKELVSAMKEKGWAYAQQFSAQKCAASVMDVYRKIMNV